MVCSSNISAEFGDVVVCSNMWRFMCNAGCTGVTAGCALTICSHVALQVTQELHGHISKLHRPSCPVIAQRVREVVILQEKRR